MIQPHRIHPPFGYVSPAAAPLFTLQTDWAELERRYRAANQMYLWTLIAGCFFLWPLWIITWRENNKIHEILCEVAAQGKDPEEWAQSLY